MKSKKEVITNYLETAEEALLKIQLRIEYVNTRYAQENKQSFLQDLAQLTADLKETEAWIEFLKSQLQKES